MTNLVTYLGRSWPEVLSLTVDHVRLVFVCVAIGSVVSVAIGLAVSTGEPNPRRFGVDWFAAVIREGSLLVTAGILTIPSLALFVLFLPITGLGETTAVLVLTLYSLYTVLRNTLAGLAAVDRSVLESARGLGFGRMRRLFVVQLPLAWPAILDGIRVTTLISIAIAAVAAIVQGPGQGPGLGQLLLTGISRIGATNALPQVLVGTVMCLVVAGVFELLFGLVARLTVPRGIRG